MEATIQNGNIESGSKDQINVKHNELNKEEETKLLKDDRIGEHQSSDHSEYDSEGTYSEDEQDVKIRSRASDLDEHSNSDNAGSITLEREEGDGQESAPTKKVDDDEDKKNPQYIPKRGTFYEHDDRTAEEIESEPVEQEKENDGKKKVWQDKKEKWSHDRFNDSEQTPKSRTELIAIYGYDIRNEEGPPRARRRRRYGRGPNKYTRNWEDEDAYNKPPVVVTRTKKAPRPRNNGEEFPPLERSRDNEDDQADIKLEQEVPNPTFVERTEAKKSAELPAEKLPSVQKYDNTRENEKQDRSNQERIGTGRSIKPKREIKDSDYRGFTTKTRQQRYLKNDQQKVLPPRNQSKNDFIQTQNFTNKNNPNLQELEKDMNKLTVDGVYKGGSGKQRQGSVPPRLQSEQKGSKRYSSMRQRSLPEANTPPVPSYQQASYYQNDYNQQTPSGSQPAILHHPNAPQLSRPALPLHQQVPVTAAPLLQAPFPQPFPQAPPAFLQPGVAPPQFIPAQTPQLINYVQGQPPFNPNFQGFQQQFNPVTQPTELYQPQGGITYYSTDQQVVQRPAPQKRPKAAIPIVAPPMDNKDDGSSSQLGGIYVEKEALEVGQ